MGFDKIYPDVIPWDDSEFEKLIPYALQIRNRYTIFNKI